jgi:hypothetical protein
MPATELFLIIAGISFFDNRDAFERKRNQGGNKASFAANLVRGQYKIEAQVSWCGSHNAN